MDDTTSEATSPHSASEYSSMHNQSNHAYQCHSQQQQNEGASHSEATQDQFLQGDASPQARLRGRRAKLSEHERRERVRLNHVNYRQRKKDKVNKMASQNQHFQDEIRHLTAENRQLKVENRRLSTENRQLKAENGRLSAENRHLKAETGRLSAEDRHLKEETKRLYLENKLLGDHIRGLRDKGQLPAEVPERQDSSISQPTCQVDQQNVYVQDHYETECNYDACVYRGHQFMEYIHNEGAADELFDINELLNPIPRENEMTSNGPVVVNEPVIEHPETSPSCTCPAEVAKIKLQKLRAMQTPRTSQA